MRVTSMVCGVVMLLSGIVAAQTAGGGPGDKYVSAKKSGTGVYANQVRGLNETPIATVGADDRLLVIKEAKDKYFVDANGKKGWVDKVAVVAVGKSKTFVFDNADVIGYLDNPTPVYIIDADDPNANPITLDRSFKDALRDNVDRETVERQGQVAK